MEAVNFWLITPARRRVSSSELSRDWPATMPIDQCQYRAVCGTFVWTFIAFMKDKGVSSRFSCFRLVPKNWDYERCDTVACRVDCPLYYWWYVHFKRDRVNTAFTCGQLLRPCTFVMTCVVVFTIGSLLLQCGDVEQNPGPDRSQECSDPDRNSPTPRGSGNGDGGDTILDGMQKLLQQMFTEQEEKLKQCISSVRDQVADISKSLKTLHGEVADLRQRTEAMESATENVCHKASEQRAAIDNLEDRLNRMQEEFDKKADRLESFSRRDNLKFCGIAESAGETFETCARKMVEVLRETVPNKVWREEDVIRAHRVGKKQPGASDKPRPLIAKFSRWADKMAILTKGRDALRQKGVAVASDLTTNQARTVRRYRDDGINAYYRGDRLVVGGPLRPRRSADQGDNNNHSGGRANNNDVRAGSAGGGASSAGGRDNPDAGSPLSYADSLFVPGRQTADPRGLTP